MNRAGEFFQGVPYVLLRGSFSSGSPYVSLPVGLFRSCPQSFSTPSLGQGWVLC